MTSLVKKVISEFIEKNKRAPDTQELTLLLKAEEKNKPLAGSKGITQYDAEITRFKDSGLASIENKNRIAFLTDLIDIGDEIESLIKSIELHHQAFMAQQSLASKEIARLNARANNLVMLSDKTNIFLYGLEETFSDNSNIDLNESTVQISNGVCTLKPKNISRNTDFSIRAGFYSNDNILAETIIGDVISLKEDDGSFWIATVYTGSAVSEVKLILNLELNDQKDISHIIINGIPLNTNGVMSCQVRYSTNGSSFIDLQNYSMEQNILYIPIGVSQVKTIQLIFSKSGSDSVTTNRQHLYSFTFDSISIYKNDYEYIEQGLLFSGPYEFLTNDDLAYDYSKVSMSCCGVFPEGTGVRFWVSNDDGANWKHIGLSNNDFVSFGARAVDYEVLDSTKNPGALVENALGLENVRSRTDAFVNQYLHADSFHAGFNHLSVTLKRGIGQWLLDEEKGEWTTTVEVLNPEGLRINLGPTSLKLNGREVSGEVYIPFGFSKIQTNVSNYLVIDSGLDNINDIRQQDLLYPYNHKYLIEGYSYPDSYIGNRVYVGADSFFVAKCIWLSPDNFAVKPYSVDNHEYYTIENVYGNYYFKVKVDKTNQNWVDEIISLDWYTPGTTNELWVKAELFSDNPRVTPVLDKFAMRVI